MDKRSEIKLIQQLKGDTYFQDELGAATIDKMCENIKNDFPIMLNTEYMEKKDLEIADLKKQLADKDKEIADILKNADKALQQCSDTATKHMKEYAEKVVINFDREDALYKETEEEFGIAFIIKTKRKNNIELSEDELDYLVSKI